ncbi:hypothetical protein AACH06_29590 [Ideonella sp. DXS29W]|uniref:Uncharacterized protein n=1 Tax=Ideonella lacteola TaxID=2984193 RepID=A0ABU9BYD2_9BURK
MSELCLLTNLSSSEWAAWVQAVGSIAAIIGAAGIAVWQSRKQHQNSIELLRAENRFTRTELARSFLSLSSNCRIAMGHAAGKLKNREAVHAIAEGQVHFDFEELKVIEGAVRAIPLHTLPSSLVGLTMIVSSTVRQFREKVQSALDAYRSMDGAAFEDFFRTLAEMQESLEASCADIRTKLIEIERDA